MVKIRGIYKQPGCDLYYIRYVGLDGKIRREATHTKDHKEAEGILIDKKKLIKDGKEPEPVKKIPNHTFEELVKDYKKWAERQRCYKSKEYLIDQLKDEFGDLPLRRFNTMLIEQYQSDRMVKGRRKTKGQVPIGNKPATINRLTATLKHMMTKAVEWELVEEGILKKVRRVKQLEENNGRLRFLTQAECQRLIECCNPLLKSIVLIALNTGLRKDNVLSLEWGANIDLNHGFIFVSQTKNGKRLEIPMNRTVRDALESLYKGTKERPRRIDIPFVFYDPSTEKRYKDVKRSFSTACKKAKIEDFTFHDLRHTFASHLVMKGVDLTTVSRLLGHKDIKMTLRYAHLAPTHMVNAVNILDVALSEKNELHKNCINLTVASDA